jgi:hypothetical protein
MQAGYKKVLPFLDGNDIPSAHGLRINFHEMAGTHAR